MEDLQDELKRDHVVSILKAIGMVFDDKLHKWRDSNTDWYRFGTKFI